MNSNFIIPLAAREATDAQRVGPKAANLAALAQAGLPTPGGFCLVADAYRWQIRHSGLEAAARGTFGTEDDSQARRYALQMKLGLMEQPVAPEVLEPLLAAWRSLREQSGAPCVVRSSALVEDRFGSSFAGQFESFLGLEDETEFLTAVRACWTALWSTRALRYMATHDLDPADTAMALLMQPLVQARCAGGALSQTGEGELLINATWGLGSAIAQGEVTPDRYVLSRDGALKEAQVGLKQRHDPSCAHSARARIGSSQIAPTPCLDPKQIAELGGLVRETEKLMNMPVEIEWALDEAGFKLLQSRPLHLQDAPVPDESWRRYPRLNGQPAGVGWGTGRACVVNCECELTRVAPGDVLVTRMAGPALGQILPRVSGVVAELGGSTSHLASLARERGIPMVLGVPDATHRIPEGSNVAVDGVAGVVRWMKSDRAAVGFHEKHEAVTSNHDSRITVSRN
ncbi:MAG: PEP-utilizing enzyme [Betaproteobacteria bacterium]|nr:PEP-utilizing enzyme [Betaproteobacteria bacterium]MDH3438148.1 PEP-utilizing enzyme [Betaproteobacteria bacterium]